MSIDEVTYAALKRIGLDISIFPMGKTAAITEAADGMYDGMYAHPAGLEKEHPSLIRLNTAIADINYLAFVPNGAQKRFTAWEDLAGYRVGFLYQRPYMEKHIPDGLPGVIRKHTWTELLQALQNGECDVILTQSVLGKEFVVPDYAEYAGIIDRSPAYIYVNAKHADLAKDLEKSLAAMQATGAIDKILHNKIHKEKEVKVVLYISSYSNETAWEQKIIEGINSVFHNDPSITYYSITLNSRRILDEERRYGLALHTLRNYFMANEVDAIIISDNDALRFVSAYYNILFTEDPIIFCGINDFDDSMLGGIKNNISGIAEAISAKENVELMLQLFPETKKIFVITEYTETGRLGLQDITRQLAPYAGRVNIVYNDNLTFTDLFAQIAALGDDALVLAGPYFIDAERQYMPQEEFHRKLAVSTDRPIFGFFDGTQGLGAIGGRYTNGVNQGRTAAEMAQQLLRGGPLPPIVRDPEEKNKWIFDYPMLLKFGIAPSSLPKDSIMLNKPPSLYETNPLLFWGLVCVGVSGMLIIAILACSIRLLRKRNAKLFEAELAAREAKDRIQKIIESAPIFYALHVDGFVVENNGYHRNFVGTRVGDDIRRKYADLGWDMGEYDDAMNAVLLGKEAVRQFPWKVVTNAGEVRRYMVTIAAAEYEGKKAVVVWGMDVEDLERRKDDLTLANQSLERVIAAAPLPIALCDPIKRLIIQANEAWANLFRFHDKAKTACFALNEGFGVPSIANKLMDALQSDETLSWDCKFRTLEGNIFEAVIYAKKIVYNNADCLVTCVRDLSEEKLRIRMLQSAADKEREASRLKLQFVMNMGHELRTPMNAVIGMTHIAKQTDDPVEIQKCLKSIDDAASHLMGIIDDVLDLSMIEEGTLKLRPEKISLKQTITSVLAMLRQEADKHGVTVISELDALGDNIVLADALRLGQIFINLVSNGIKFNRNGGSVTVSAQRPVRQNGHATYRFAVADTGIGIPADKLDRLFKPFEQIDGSLTRRHGGAGVGLVLSRTIISMLGGTIDVTSEEGVGSVFSFTINVPLVEKGQEHEESADGETAGINFSNMRALIVDDIELNRIIAETLFSDLGLKMELAENGRQALDMVAASTPGYYDFVLMDIQMPELDGCDATKAIRQLDRPDAAILPIIAMTANVTEDDINMCRQAGMNGHIGKPIDLDSAIATVSKALRHAERQ